MIDYKALSEWLLEHDEDGGMCFDNDSPAIHKLESDEGIPSNNNPMHGGGGYIKPPVREPSTNSWRENVITHLTDQMWTNCEIQHHAPAVAVTYTYEQQQVVRIPMGVSTTTYTITVLNDA